jgi:hypothetical protein
MSANGWLAFQKNTHFKSQNFIACGDVFFESCEYSISARVLGGILSLLFCLSTTNVCASRMVLHIAFFSYPQHDTLSLRHLELSISHTLSSPRSTHPPHYRTASSLISRLRLEPRLPPPNNHAPSSLQNDMLSRLVVREGFAIQEFSRARMNTRSEISFHAILLL